MRCDWLFNSFDRDMQSIFLPKNWKFIFISIVDLAFSIPFTANAFHIDEMQIKLKNENILGRNA